MADIRRQCYTPSGPTTTGMSPNCSCEPCREPELVDCCDIGETTCTPILTDVIQNCTVDEKREVAYPDNLVFETNLLKDDFSCLTGNICIRNVEFSYNCVGFAPDDVASSTISVWINSKERKFNVNKNCVCEDPNPSKTVPISDQISGVVRTSNCCCGGRPQEYAQTKIVDKNLNFYACDFNIRVTGKIGCQEFVANSVGILHHGTLKFFPRPVKLKDIGFNKVNFAEKLCLPTDTQVTISELFESNLCVDCVFPIDETYSSADDPGTGTLDNLAFTASAEISLFIKKSLYASVRKALAVLTKDVRFNCQKQTAPMCPKSNPCKGTAPCTPCESPSEPPCHEIQ